MSTTIELPITGMTCASCANRIERKLNKLDGVHGERQLRHREGDGRLRPGGGRARGARRRRRGRRLPGARCRPTSPTARGGRRDRAAAPPADHLRAAVAAGAAGLDDPGAAVRQLAVAGAQRWPRRSCSGARGRSTAPRGRTCSHGTATMDTLISLGTLAAWLWSLYALVFGDAGMAGMRMSFDLIPEQGEGANRHLPRDRRGRHHVHPRRALLRGAREAPRRRRAEGAAGARRQGGHAARRADDRPIEQLEGRRRLPRPPGREGRHRRRRRGGPLGGRHEPADRRVGAGRGRARATRSRARPSTPAGASSSARRRSAPTPRWPRSPGS